MYPVAICVFTLFLISTLVILRASSQLIRFLKPESKKDGLQCTNTSEELNRNLQDEFCPRVAVLMAVRGLDPSLVDCVTSLMKQDYPDYLLKIVVDSEEDESWQVLQRLSATSDHRLEVVTLKKRYPTCGLKCSALIQAISQLEPSIEVVAFADSDIIAPRNWLRELIAPFKNPEVGLTSGLPWYLPEENNLGSLVRYLWNIYGVTGRYLCKIPSGASMAIRRNLLTEDQILGLWQKVLSEDITAAVMVKQSGLDVRFVPSLLMVNRESCSLRGCWKFAKRQFLWTRLYSNQWSFVASQAFLRITALLLGLIILPISYYSQEYTVALLIVLGLAIYFLSIITCTLLIQATANERLRQTEAAKTPISSSLQFPRVILPFMITHLMVLASTVAAMGVHNIEWRGIEYEISDDLEIRMLKYAPYKPESHLANSSIL